MTGRVANHATRPGGTRYSTCQGAPNGTFSSWSRTIHGRNDPAYTPMVTSGSGIGSRRSYSLYSRFSMLQTLVYVGRSMRRSPR
ncbi:hypothetical protein R9X44_02495 [Actinocorallia sp. A-T 12471]|nr:hypothetical protein [Actinocorallia sp. A-T 12471]MDX6738619.1 hypothetical protein [Actinocorallia sp. A-T 12471]